MEGFSNMPRFNNALLTGQSFSRGRMVPQLDVQYGGQNGYAPHLGEWASTTHYVRRNLVCMLIEAPKAFAMMPDPTFYVSALKSLVEIHAKTWDGFNAGLTVEVSETAVGGAGEKFHDITNVTRAQTVPVSTFTDMYGRPIQHFLNDWITYLIGDPDTKVPMLSTIAGVKPSDMLADMYSATMLFYEPDPTHTKIAKAWLTTNMYPKSNGDWQGKRDLTAAGEPLELSIEWTGLTQSGRGVEMFAQKLMDTINLANANPNLRKSFMQNITSDVASNFAARTYEKGTEIIGSEKAIVS
jgi:hypothetical protein